MDALKRAVDLMDESAVKLTSARGRFELFSFDFSLFSMAPS
jgi:hypothetical protein